MKYIVTDFNLGNWKYYTTFISTLKLYKAK